MAYLDEELKRLSGEEDVVHNRITELRRAKEYQTNKNFYNQYYALALVVAKSKPGKKRDEAVALLKQFQDKINETTQKI